MRKSFLYIALASIVLAPLALAAQDVKPVSKPHFTSLEVKHFTTAEGVQLSPNFSKYFYASFLAELQRLDVAEQTAEEGATVNDTQGSHGMIPHFIVLEGQFVSVQEGREKDGKFEAGYANIEIRYFRRSDHKALSFNNPKCDACNMPVLKTKVTFNGSLKDDEQKVAEAAGVQLADAIRKNWYPSKASWLEVLGM